jgi:radical SAM enzyme (TIGR01210 family)
MSVVDHQQETIRWLLSLRGPRNRVDPSTPYLFFCEEERSISGKIVSVATIFLTNRECPWRCLMCDLWQNTLNETVPFGAIPTQIDYALERLGPASEIKLYNSGSFFDKKAIPEEDHRAIAHRVRNFENVIVECHPALVNENSLRFAKMIDGRFEVAMGLETTHEGVLQKLNKGMTLHQFSKACEFLKSNGIGVRAFILVKPPFMNEEEALIWAKRSVDFAFDCGVDAAVLIPTRFGNGALESLASTGLFSVPKISTLEAAAEYGIAKSQGRIFCDLWNLKQFSECSSCLETRTTRLAMMNLHQQVPSRIQCRACGENC